MVDGVGVRPMQMKATRKCGLRDKTHGEGVWPQGGGKQCCRMPERGVQGWDGGTVLSVMQRPRGFRRRSPYVGLLALWVGHFSACEWGKQTESKVRGHTKVSL